MSDTVKLIIEIPKVPKNDHERWVLTKGIPLDDIKAEIEALQKTYPFVNHIDTYVKEDDVLHILDNIGEADFPQTKDVEPTVDNFSKVLDNELIRDAIRDYETDTKGKSCNTCKNNDDEFSGECYECLKGIFDHYEPQESEE